MKHLLFLLFIIPTSLLAQDHIAPFELNTITSKLYRTTVHTDESQSLKDLHELSLKFLAHSFGDSKEVIRHNNPESGEIIGKGYYDSGFDVNYHFTFNIQSKEGKARMIITDVEVKTNVGNYEAEQYYWWKGDIDGKPKKQKGGKKKMHDVLDSILNSWKTAVESKQNGGFSDF